MPSIDAAAALHAARHAAGGPDPVTPYSIGAVPADTEEFQRPRGIYPVGVHVDTMTTSGSYWVSGQATTANGFPWVPHAFGILTVFRANGATYVQQTYQSSNARAVVWTRINRGGVWSAWEVVGPIRHTQPPASVITAPAGTEVIDVTATNGARSWLKQSDTGNSDWIVLDGDTGWRQTTAFLSAGFATDKARLRRVGQTVSVNLQGATVAGSHSYVVTGMPSGFRPSSSGVVFPIFEYVPAAATKALGHFGLNSSGTTFLRVVAAGSLFFECSYLTDDPWPTTLPGTSA